jgi:hypothetical protein
MFKENPLTILQLFVSEQRELIQSSIHFYGKTPKVGSYLTPTDEKLIGKTFPKTTFKGVQSPYSVQLLPLKFPKRFVTLGRVLCGSI